MTLADVSKVEAGSLGVVPIRVDLTSTDTMSQLEISNTSEEASFVQVTAIEWVSPDSIAHGKMATSLLVVPPIFDLDPGRTQLVRLAHRGPVAGAMERTYRLLIQEVPKTAGLVPNTVTVAAQMNLPVFVTPEGAAPSPGWEIRGDAARVPSLAIVNEGTAYISVKTLKLLAADLERPVFETNAGGVVFAGGERSWTLDADLARLKGPFTVRAETNIGPLEASVAFPGR